jgi:hypothetical protein
MNILFIILLVSEFNFGILNLLNDTIPFFLRANALTFIRLRLNGHVKMHGQTIKQFLQK